MELQAALAASNPLGFNQYNENEHFGDEYKKYGPAKPLEKREMPTNRKAVMRLTDGKVFMGESDQSEDNDHSTIRSNHDLGPDSNPDTEDGYISTQGKFMPHWRAKNLTFDANPGDLQYKPIGSTRGGKSVENIARAKKVDKFSKKPIIDASAAILGVAAALRAAGPMPDAAELAACVWRCCGVGVTTDEVREAMALEGAFAEEQHPRDDAGKFTAAGGQLEKWSKRRIMASY